jgi:cyclopropane-fatty-acyl-phospholipid synthase
MTDTAICDGAPRQEGGLIELFKSVLGRVGITLNGSQASDPQILNPQFYQRVVKQGSLGLGESYMDGWWECSQLDVFFERVLKGGLEQRFSSGFANLLQHAYVRIFNLQSRSRAWIVGKEHYDLGNDLFSLMLDSHMQYSCGYWKNASTLEQAQHDKLQLICEKLGLQPGMRLLDIGCGWGGLAEFAARHYGVQVVGVTISVEQQKMAQERCRDLDVSILLQDYRDLNGQFDRIVSVGMFEHVGAKNYQTYFDVVKRNLKPDGLFLLHTIGANRTGPGVDPWIHKYIFPNGCLPSVAHISKASEGALVMEDWHNFGADYDRTLMAWSERFKAAWPQLSGNYSPRFYRMFTYYLHACAGAFRARDIQLWQVLFSNQGVPGGIRVAR